MIENYLYLKRKQAFFPDSDELLSEMQKIIKIIDLLPNPQHKTILFMYYIEDISINGIANYMHFTPIWIKKQKAKALKMYTEIYLQQMYNINTD